MEKHTIHVPILTHCPISGMRAGAGRLWSSLVEGDEWLLQPNCQTNFIYCPSLSVSIILAFHKHNSLPLGPLWAFISFYWRAPLVEDIQGLISPQKGQFEKISSFVDKSGDKINELNKFVFIISGDEITVWCMGQFDENLTIEFYETLMPSWLA